jgi:hypothetical protein
VSEDIDTALSEYMSAGSTGALLELRSLLEPLLIDRLTSVASAPARIYKAIDDTFELFVHEATPSSRRNWRMWFAMTAMSFAAEDTEWIDAAGSGLPEGSKREKRAIIFGLILKLDGRCQWLLLEAPPSHQQPRGECAAKMQQLLAQLL